jgi:hypothetical protein
MAFEKWKSGIRVGGVAATIAGALGRLRYGSSRV